MVFYVVYLYNKQINNMENQNLPKFYQNRLRDIKLAFYVADDMRDNIIEQLDYHYERLKKLHTNRDEFKEAIKKSRTIKKLHAELTDLKDSMKRGAYYSKVTKQVIKLMQQQNSITNGK